MSCQITSSRAVKTYSASAATQDMTTFNLSMELCQSPFYPKDRERDLLPLMEFKDCSMSDKESWEVSDSARYEVRKGMYIAMWVLVCCLKGYLLHHSSATVTASFPTFNRPTGEDEEMVHQSSSESELEGHQQHQTRQLFMGDDSLQISQSVERHSGWQWGVPWNWRSQQPAFISSGFFPTRCNSLTARGYWWICHNTHKPILHKYVFLMKMYSRKTKEWQGNKLIRNF